MRFFTAITCISPFIIGVYGLDWFGPKNQYKCHCSESLCLADGQCGVRSKCEAGWFGPKCQYQDLVTQGVMTLSPSMTSKDMNNLIDRDDTTCVRNLISIQIDWNIEYPFTWLRVVLNDQDFSKELSVQFSMASTRGKKLACEGQQISNVNNRTKDIYCFLNVTVRQLTLAWNTSVSLCSFYVSGGRNVALKQQARQSSDYSRTSWLASVAVDGNTDSDFTKGSCTHTNEHESTAYWDVKFSPTVSVNRFLLYNRADRSGRLDDNSKRLQNFKLECFTITNQQVCSPPQDPKPKLKYTVVQMVKEPISDVRIVATYEDLILTLCEVEIFGDSVCNSNLYGPECNSSCNCKDKSESCFVATGGCPSGCAPGYYEEGCKTECPTGSWGSDCLLFCNNCVENSCNKKTGKCVKGCDGYSDPPNCQKACDVTHYGVNCLNTCPVNCNSDGCDHKIGACFGCIPGYHGAGCDQVCEFGKYGQNCSLICSKVCLKNGSSTWCGNVDGRCLHGCNESYNLQDHDECSFYSSQHGSPVPLAAVLAPVVVLIVLVLLILVVATVLIRRRKHQVVENKAHDIKHLEKNDFPLQKGGIRETSIEMDEVLTIENASKEETEYFNSTPEQPKTSIAVTELNDFLMHHQKEFFIQQFQSIPAPKNVTMEVGTSQLNMNKNRYKNIITYDHSRVHLKINTDKLEGDYINASYVEGYKNEEKYIASQGPNSAMINDFVRMLWEQKVEKVVMLTNLVENGKAKCERYWPTNEEEKFGSIKIRLTTTQIFADYTIRRLELIKKESATQTFMQFHFTTWPDKGVPTSPWGLVDFEQRVASYPTDGPIVVHCSAGVGRTGTFIALRNIMREAEDTGKIDFFSTVSKLRQDRMMMIQTAEQYEFLHRSAQVAMVCIGTTITAKSIASRIKHLESVLPSGKTLMEKEFEDVCNVSEDNHLINRGADSEENPENIYQNKETFSLEMKTDRSVDIKPKQYRVQLTGDSDFINAVIVPSFTKSDQQILTHLPTSATVMEFWQMIIQYKVSLVLAFEVDAMVGDESLGDYLPSSSEPLKTPQFEVYMESLECEQFWEEKKLKVVVKQMSNVRSKEHTVTHVKCTFHDLDPKKVLSFLKQARSYNALKDGIIVYMCRNGAKYCGLACALTLLMDRMENDLNLTVPLVVGCLKTIRPEIIPSLVQYRVLYQVLLRYRETSASYTNFGDSTEQIHQSSETKHAQENETEANDDINIYANT